MMLMLGYTSRRRSKIRPTSVEAYTYCNLCLPRKCTSQPRRISIEFLFINYALNLFFVHRRRHRA
jgi:hypothetical protein